MQISSKKIKRIFWASLLSLAIVIIPQISHALTVQEVPNSRQVNGGWVTDMANIISNNTETELNRIITELEAKNGTEIAVVTVPETAPSPTPKAFATELFNHWGIGKQGADNGVLFLVSVGDRRVEIETGYGVEGILPDAKVGNIIETKITPRLKKGDFDGGILVGTKSLVGILGGEISLTETETQDVPAWLLGTIPGGMIAAIAGLITSFKKHKKNVAIAPFGYSRIDVNKKDFIYGLIYWSSFLLILALTPLLISLAVIVNPILVLAIPLASFVFCAVDLGSKKQFLYILGVLFVGMFLATFFGILLVVILPNAASFILVFSFISLPSSIWTALPVTNILYQKLEEKKRFICQNCGREMVEIDQKKLTPCLDEHQQKAEELKSLKYKGLQCPNCSEKDEAKIHIRAHILSDRIYSDCPVGNELTVTKSEEILEFATYSNQGKKRVKYTCKCCDYREEREEKIPRKVRSSSSSSSGGGSSFGGGSSGGGGAGGGF